MIDLRNDILVNSVQNIGTISSNTTTTSTSIDSKGYNSLTFVIYSGNITDGVYTPSIEGSTDNTNWTALGTDELLGTVSNATLISTSDNVVKTIGIASRYRYYRLKIVSTGVTTGGTISALTILAYPTSLPTSGN